MSYITKKTFITDKKVLALIIYLILPTKQQ